MIQTGFIIANALTIGASVFLVAAGLTLIFGILNILNFAHGAFFALGAYITFWLVQGQPSSIATLCLAAAGSGVAVGALGFVTDRLVFRRLHSEEQAYTLIATFALMLLLTGGMRLIWGPNAQAASPPPELSGIVDIGGVVLPAYSIALMAASGIVFVALEIFIQRSWQGKMLMAVARDRAAASIMGVNVSLMLTGSAVAGSLLAGAAGGLLLPNQALSPELGSNYLLLAFNAVIIGGLGSIRGALAASLILGLGESLSSIVMPDTPGVTPYIVLIGFLVLRPDGLFPVRA